MKRAAVILGLVVFLVLAGTGIGFAYWSATSDVSGSVTAGTFEVTLDGVEQLDTVYSSTSPGPVIASLSLGATGSGPVDFSPTTSSDNASLAEAIRFRTWLPAGSGCGASVPSADITTSTLAAPLLPSGADSVSAPTAIVVCAATDVTETFASHAGQSTTVTMTLTGALGGSSWTAVDSGFLEQALAGAAPSLVCVDTTDGSNVVVTWSNSAAAPTSVQYRAVFVPISGGGETAIIASPSYWYTELWVSAGIFPSVGDYTVLVRMYADSALSGAGTLVGQRTVHVTSNEWNTGQRVQCG
jgi:predicted ribosomally synthesized peptide with SipW-like signal peptide